ncbi:acyl-CoA dehydrogenase family protein [Sphingomonas sp. MMS24-JH45]
MNERLAVGGGGGAGPKEILKLAREVDAGDGKLLHDPAFRQKLADWWVQAEGLRNTRMRTITALSRGQTPGPESSIGKVIAANQLQDMGHSAVEAMDQYRHHRRSRARTAEGPVPVRHPQCAGDCASPAAPTDPEEHHRRARFGAPGEIRTDKDAAFKDLSVGR